MDFNILTPDMRYLEHVNSIVHKYQLIEESKFYWTRITITPDLVSFLTRMIFFLMDSNYATYDLNIHQPHPGDL